MPELRRNKLTGEWVSIAEERAKRPSSFVGIGLDNETTAECPFCKGNEHLSSEEVYRSADGRVRIVTNKYPIVTKDSELGFGIHDVVIDTDLHDELLQDFSIFNIKQILIGIKARVNELKMDKRVKYIQVFKNQGVMAGASQPHSHWQIVGVPIISLMQKNIYENALKIYKQSGKCYICEEIVNNPNVLKIYENASFLAYCNFASKFCYEVQIAPKKHYANMQDIDDNELEGFAMAIKKCLIALGKIYKDMPFNICFYNSFENMDTLEGLDKCMHFYAQIIPRIGSLAGFEFSTTSYINSVPPEKAAKRLKQIIDDDIE